MSKFVIFAHARSGSTSLARVLAVSKDVKMAIEPFHPKYSEWNPDERNYSEFIKDPETMNKALDELFSKYSAIKVLDYQFPKEIYFTMLARKDLRFVLLRRKNLLEAAISNAVGEQTHKWHKEEYKKTHSNLKPININKVSKWLGYEGKLVREYYKYLTEHRKGDFLPLYYEDLYSENFEENERNIERVCKFLDIALPPDEAIERYMMPSKARINYQNIYRKIPNYEEIIKRFGKNIT